jgi:hypothetical protein
MKIRFYLLGLISGLVLMLIIIFILNIRISRYNEININSYEDILNNYVPDISVKSASSARMVGNAYISDIYGKGTLTWSTVDYDKDNGYWVISRYGILESLKKVVVDEKTGGIISAIGYK